MKERKKEIEGKKCKKKKERNRGKILCKERKKYRFMPKKKEIC